MSKKLAATVHVTDDDGTTHVYGPDSDDIPAEHAEKITNKGAWADDGEAKPFDPAVTENTPAVNASPDDSAARVSEADTAPRSRRRSGE